MNPQELRIEFDVKMARDLIPLIKPLGEFLQALHDYDRSMISDEFAEYVTETLSILDDWWWMLLLLEAYEKE